MAEAIRRTPGGDLQEILKQVLGNFVVAQVTGKVSRMFPGKCIACKEETVPYKIIAKCKTPTDKPEGSLAWYCTFKRDDFVFIGERDIIIGRIVGAWEKK